MSAQPRELSHPTRDEIRLESVLHALSDPTRLHIARTIDQFGAAVSCSDIEVEVTKSTSTHHYRVLREAGVIRQTYQGTAKLNGLRRDDLDTRFPGLMTSILGAEDKPK